MRRIDVLMAYAESDPEGQALVAAFREGLQKLGWTESSNIRIDTRWATADVELMQRFAREIVEQRPDLILTQKTPTTAAMLQQTRSIPIMLATGSLPSIRGASTPKSPACCPTELTYPIIIGVRRSVRTASSRARSRTSFRSKPRSSSFWLSAETP